MKTGTFKNYIKPFVVLVVICLCAAVLLGFTNNLTEPVIEENNLIAAEETRESVMPGGTGFTEIECDYETLGISSAYRENSGLGYVISAQNKGYGGIVTVTVGLDNDGVIVGIAADVGTETTGVGSRAGNEDYLSKFMGAQGNADDIDTLTNATYSSTAIKKGVNSILAAFDVIKEAK